MDSLLNAFLNPINSEETKEIEVSNRFVDKDGKRIKITIKALSQSDLDTIHKKSTRMVSGKNGMKIPQIDMSDVLKRTVLEGIVAPNFKSNEACSSVGVVDPLDAITKIFNIGEFQKIAEAIGKLSGLDFDYEDELEQAKN